MPADRRIKLEIDATVSNGEVTIEMRSKGGDMLEIQKVLNVAIAGHLYRMWKVDKNKLDFESFLHAFNTFNTETLCTTLTFAQNTGAVPQETIH